MGNYKHTNHYKMAAVLNGEDDINNLPMNVIPPTTEFTTENSEDCSNTCFLASGNRVSPLHYPAQS